MKTTFEKYECDRCGAYREKSERTDPEALKDWNHIEAVPFGHRFGEGLHLCSVCAQSYAEWFDKGKRR